MVITKKAIYGEYEQEKLKKLLDKLAIPYNDITLYILAFIHRSIVNERPDYTPEHNERLEFLGDAVLELIITDALYNKFPKKPEGELTDIRSALVRGKNLAKVARKLNFNEYLFLGKGEEKTGGRENDYLLANSLEAFIGALYIDLGIDFSKKFIIQYIFETLDTILKNNLTKDFKTIFQEYSQAEYDITPTYKILSDQGPDHNKIYKVGIYVGEKEVGVGEGTSKKKAQEEAAKNAYLNK